MAAMHAVEEQVLAPLRREESLDAEEEEVKSTNEKADGILNFWSQHKKFIFMMVCFFLLFCWIMASTTLEKNEQI